MFVLYVCYYRVVLILEPLNYPSITSRQPVEQEPGRNQAGVVVVVVVVVVCNMAVINSRGHQSSIYHIKYHKFSIYIYIWYSKVA
jgi:hypothetical protein